MCRCIKLRHLPDMPSDPWLPSTHTQTSVALPSSCLSARYTHTYRERERACKILPSIQSLATKALSDHLPLRPCPSISHAPSCNPDASASARSPPFIWVRDRGVCGEGKECEDVQEERIGHLALPKSWLAYLDTALSRSFAKDWWKVWRSTMNRLSISSVPLTGKKFRSGGVEPGRQASRCRSTTG